MWMDESGGRYVKPALLAGCINVAAVEEIFGLVAYRLKFESGKKVSVLPIVPITSWQWCLVAGFGEIRQ